MLFNSISLLGTYHHVRKSITVFFVPKYSYDTYTSPAIGVIWILMDETGRQDFVFEGFNNVHNSMITLSWCRHLFKFLTNRAASPSSKSLRDATPGKQQTIDLYALVLASCYLCDVYLFEGCREQFIILGRSWRSRWRQNRLYQSFAWYAPTSVLHTKTRYQVRHLMIPLVGV